MIARIEMKILSVTAQKGGVGKSSVCLNLAGQAQAAGLNVAIVDTDQQGSLSLWSEYRESATPFICTLDETSDSIDEFIEGARNDGFDLLIFDTPPKNKNLISIIARKSDFVLIVTKPAIFDVLSISETVNMMNTIDCHYRVLFNGGAAPRNSFEDNDIRDARKLLNADNVPLFTQALANRKPIQHAQKAFELINEYEPSGAATQEINQVWKELEKEL